MRPAHALLERVIGRDTEMRQLRAALRDRRSQLIWGPADSGKTFLIANVLADLPANERRKCICWAGPASRRQLVEHLIRELFLAGDPFVCAKVRQDRCREATLSRWIGEQSALRLRGILFTAAEKGEYRIFLDHLAPVSAAFAQLLKEVMYRAKTPVYLTGHGYSYAELGHAWSLYWTDEYRIRLGPISEEAARELMEISEHRFGLGALDPEAFREDLLRLSGHLPGSIVKMCELAAHPRYHYGDQLKLKLLHVDYLLHAKRLSSDPSYPS
jgi:AAA ATPase domain